MEKAQKILVFLDLTEIDNLLIKYASFISELLESKEVYFLHVFEYEEVSEELSKVFPDLDEPLDKVIEDEIREKINKYFNNEQSDTFIKLMQSTRITGVLKWAEQEQIDLMLVGKKISFKGKGNMAGKIARLSHSSVLFLTETSKGLINKIMVPVDFSSHSELALKKAMELAEKTGAELFCQNVYRVPPQYFPYISVKQEQVETIQNEHKKDYKKFLKRCGATPDKVPCECTIDHHNNVADEIYRYAVEKHADLLVIGSKGKTDAASFLLGSVAEKLISNEKNLPVLIVKDKNQTFGLLDALLKLKF